MAAAPRACRPALSLRSAPWRPGSAWQGGWRASTRIPQVFPRFPKAPRHTGLVPPPPPPRLGLRGCHPLTQFRRISINSSFCSPLPARRPSYFYHLPSWSTARPLAGRARPGGSFTVSTLATAPQRPRPAPPCPAPPTPPRPTPPRTRSGAADPCAPSDLYVPFASTLSERRGRPHRRVRATRPVLH